MSDFKGMVKVLPSQLSIALKNYNAFNDKAWKEYAAAKKKAKEDRVEVRSWIFFKKEISVWEKITGDWNGYFWGVRSVYPDILSAKSAEYLNSGGDNGMYAIENMYKTKSDDIYLNPEQARLVTKWASQEVA